MTSGANRSQTFCAWPALKSAVHCVSAARMAAWAALSGCARAGETAAPKHRSATKRTMAYPAIGTGLRRRSFHRRDDEFRAFLDAGRPARGHGLGLGVEADRVRAVLIEIAEARAFPAAECVIGEGDWNCEVHADHADVDAR